MLPFDLVPDFIPVLGQLDDVLIVPGLIYLALRIVPDEVVAQCRSESRRMNNNVNNGKEKNGRAK